MTTRRAGERSIVAAAVALTFGFLAVSACEGDKPPEEAAVAPADTPAAPAPIQTKPLPELFSKTAATMPVLIEGVKFGMTKAQVEEAAPDLAGKTQFVPKDFDGVGITAHYYKDTGKLRYVYVSISQPRDAVRKILGEIWGESEAGALEKHDPAYFWFNEEAGVQAMIYQGKEIEHTVLKYTPFMSWKQLLGEGKKKFGFETEPLIGMSAEDVLTKYADLDPEKKDDTRIDLRLPPIEMDDDRRTVIVTLEEGKVVKFYFSLPYGRNIPMAAQIDKGFEAKYGEPPGVTESHVIWSLEPLVEVSHDKEDGKFNVRVTPKYEKPKKKKKRKKRRKKKRRHKKK